MSISQWGKDKFLRFLQYVLTDECIRQGTLRDFLLQDKIEVKHMSIFEYNEEDARWKNLHRSMMRNQPLRK